jgi:hypothetical protein
MAGVIGSHARRLAKWSRLGGAPLIALVRCVEERLLPPFLDAGFVRVDVHGWDRSFPVSASELHLERRKGDVIQAVSVSFDKYHRPAFQVHLFRCAADPPHERLGSASMVKRPGRCYDFWGKPWWLPVRFWPARASDRTVARLAGLLDQSLAFLDLGERGPNISPPVDLSGLFPPKDAPGQGQRPTGDTGPGH